MTWNSEIKVRLKNILNEYIENQPLEQQFNFLPKFEIPQQLPVAATNTSWARKESSLKRTFSFSNRNSLRDFIEKVLDYEDNVGMFSNIVIEDKTVIINLTPDHSKRFKSMIEEFANETDGY